MVNGKYRFGFFFDDSAAQNEYTNGGKVWSVKIWDAPLTSTQVQQAMNAVPTTSTTAATNVTLYSATANGAITSNGTSTAATFEYGITTGYGNNLAAIPGTLDAAATNTAVSVDLTNLTCNTIYHYRVNGQNADGMSNGSDLSFTTSACPTTTPETFSVSSSTTGSGTISPSSVAVPNGAQTAITVTATAGNYIKSISGCGGMPFSSSTSLVNPRSYMTGTVTTPCTVYATFAAIPANVSIQAVGGMTLAASSQIVTGSGSYLLIEKGNWINNSATGLSGSGTVVLKGTTAVQSVAGSQATTFPLLKVDNAAGLNLSQSASIQSGLTMTSGKITLGSNNLTMKSGATISGATSSNYLVASGSGELRKEYSAPGSFTYPIGDASSYSPATLNFASGTFGAGGYSGVKLSQNRLSGDTNPSDWLYRNWSVSNSGINTFNASAEFIYLPADVYGSEAALKTAGTFSGTSANADSVNHKLSATNITALGSFGGVSQTAVTQASQINFSAFDNGGLGYTVNWTNGNGTARAVFMRPGNSGTASPTFGTTYTASSTFGSGTQIGSSGWFCIYNGTASTVAVTGLSPSTTYQVQVIEYNGAPGSESYLTTTASGNPAAQVTMPAPTTQANNLVFSNVSTTGFSAGWISGTTGLGYGTSRKVFVAEADSGSAVPLNGTDYTANSIFKSGNQIGSSGWYCVYSGSGTSATVSGLSAAKTYRVHVTEFNGSGVSTVYNSGTNATNPLSQKSSEPFAVTIPAATTDYSMKTAAVVVANDAVVTGNSITNFTVAISSGFATGDILAWNAAAGISGNYDNVTGILTFSGSTTSANWQELLRTVTFANSTLNAGIGKRVITFANAGLSISATRSINIIMPTPGNALAFDGVDDYLAFTTSTYDNAAMTAEAWIKTSSANNEHEIVSWAKYNHQYDLATFRTSAGHLQFGVRQDTNWSSVTGTTLVNDGRWHHVAAVKNGTAVTLFIDGKQEAPSGGVSTITLTPQAFDRMHLGVLYQTASVVAGTYYSGSMDEVRLWNVAKTEEEIQASMNSTLAGDETGLTAYYRFDQGTSGGTNSGNTTLRDLQTNSTASDGTLTNFALIGTASNWVESYAVLKPAIAEPTIISKGNFTANWGAAAFATAPANYYIDVTTDPTFATIDVFTNQNAGSGTSYVVTVPMQLTTYYYRVRGYSAAYGTSQDSAVGQATTVADGRPVATSQNITAIESGAAITVTLAGTDGDGDALSYIISALPNYGTLTQFDGTAITAVPTTVTDASYRVKYSPGVYYGTDNFSFIANDGMLDSFPVAVAATVYRAISMSPATLTSGAVSVLYIQSITTTGGSGTYSYYAVTSGSLPAGLALNPSTGTITGTPTLEAISYPKTFTFTIRATDSAGFAGFQAFSLTMGNTRDVTTAVTNGAFTPASIAVTNGSTTILKVDAATGYHITGISGCGLSYTPVAYANNSTGVTSYDYTTGAINADCVVSATTAINVYTITPTVTIVE